MILNYDYYSQFDFLSDLLAKAYPRKDSLGFILSISDKAMDG